MANAKKAVNSNHHYIERKRLGQNPALKSKKPVKFYEE